MGELICGEMFGWMVMLLPTYMDRKIGKWLYYNFTDESFHIKKLCSKVYSTEIDFCLKNTNWLFEPPFGGLKGNIHSLDTLNADVHTPCKEL